ncbi:hypothetical protein EJ110_NYTH32194 [Nymphaea thermarum]|nr:hypothetical protein EJ110_NYTH32194 [Nymphaea thermarum]
MSRCTYIPLSKSVEAAEELRMKEHRASFTIDCLQRRLLAERMESRAALAEVDRLQKRVMQLERRLEEEVELVRKAERAFRSAIKKLESLDLLSFEFGHTNTTRRSWSNSTHEMQQNGQTGGRKGSLGREQPEPGAESKDQEQTQKACFTSRTGELSGYAKSQDICVT